MFRQEQKRGIKQIFYQYNVLSGLTTFLFKYPYNNKKYSKSGCFVEKVSNFALLLQTFLLPFLLILINLIPFLWHQ
jgi:hypothetical protein